MNYKETLLSPNISWDSLTANIIIPEKLYKYQSFFNLDGKNNPYWVENMQGQFHMSLGCEFEDTYDCRPNFSKDHIIKYIDDFFTHFNTDCETKKVILEQINTSLTDDYFNSIISNYRRNIRIGCFTDQSDNKEMWIKYSYNKTGYCIEYDTSKNSLFELSTLPVLYDTQTYDCSQTLAVLLILESLRKAKKRTLEDNIKCFSSLYDIILKTAYIHLFIKQKEFWEFEREYRMFLLPNRNTRMGILKSSNYLNNNYNLDLSSAISAVYLGENFSTLDNSDNFLKQIVAICKEKHIKLFKKTIIHGGIENVKII